MEKEALQKAADEARKAARAARELGNSLDDYAKYLTQPSWQDRADDLRLSALVKLGVINDGLAACDRWREEGGKNGAAQTAEQMPRGKAGEYQESKKKGNNR